MKAELEVRTDTIKQLAKRINMNLKCEYNIMQQADLNGINKNVICKVQMTVKITIEHIYFLLVMKYNCYYWCSFGLILVALALGLLIFIHRSLGVRYMYWIFSSNNIIVFSNIDNCSFFINKIFFVFQLTMYSNKNE